jgi:hypothetical protein
MNSTEILIAINLSAANVEVSTVFCCLVIYQLDSTMLTKRRPTYYNSCFGLTGHTVLPTAHCTLPTAHCTLHTAHCPLPTAHCSLPTAHCPLLTAHCPLPTAHCSLLTAHCPLLTAHHALQYTTWDGTSV